MLVIAQIHFIACDEYALRAIVHEDTDHRLEEPDTPHRSGSGTKIGTTLHGPTSGSRVGSWWAS